MRIEKIGNATLYLGDCQDILPSIGKVDAVVTDPPYGINVCKTGKIGSGLLAKVKDYGSKDWDKRTPSESLIQTLLDISTNQIIFGGNYFNLPPTSCWLIWDKQNGANDFADAEMAWTNLKSAVRLIQWRWNGMIRKGNDVREHPTQKPVGVMEWCIQKLPDTAQTILDPFMGSGTTGVACAKLGRSFIGIERDEEYFDIACRRIEEAYKQPDMFVSAPTPEVEQAVITF